MKLARNTIGIIAALLLAVTSVCFVIGFLAPNSWVLEMFTHGRWIYLVLFLLAAILLFITKYRKLAAVALALLLFASVDVINYWFEKPTQIKTTANIKIVQMNLWGGKNRNVDDTLNVAAREKADVIVLSEVTSPWWLRFIDRFPDYPYRIVEPRYGGVGLLSRLPIKSGEVRYFGKLKRPRIVADLQAPDGTTFELIFAHTFTPFSRPPMRDEELKLVAAEAKSARYPVVVCGDINCSPWSPIFARFLQESNLIDSERGFGCAPTWAFPNSPIAVIPIDHLFVSKDMTVLSRTIGSKFGSDHWPVTAVVGFRAAD